MLLFLFVCVILIILSKIRSSRTDFTFSNLKLETIKTKVWAHFFLSFSYVDSLHVWCLKIISFLLFVFLLLVYVCDNFKTVEQQTGNHNKMTVSQRAQLYVMLEFSLFCVKCAVNVFLFLFFFVFISFYFLVVFLYFYWNHPRECKEYIRHNKELLFISLNNNFNSFHKIFIKHFLVKIYLLRIIFILV